MLYFSTYIIATDSFNRFSIDFFNQINSFEIVIDYEFNAYMARISAITVADNKYRKCKIAAKLC